MDFFLTPAGVVFIIIVVVIALAFIFLRGEEKEVYDQILYEGQKTDFCALSSKDLYNWVNSRDQEDFSFDLIGGSVIQLAVDLKTDPEKGIRLEDSDLRRKHFGVNQYKPIPVRSFRDFWFDTLEDKTLRILTGSSIISIILGVTVDKDPSTGWIEGAAILFAVLLVSLVTAGNDYSKDRKFRQLSEIHKDKKVKVIREGSPQVISIYDLLVGDILCLETGDYIPADALYISGHGCSVKESAMTGEALPVKKNDKDPFFISGCMVEEGSATSLVIATGMNSVFGNLKKLVDKEDEGTPLQHKLDELADFIGKCGASAALLTFVVLMIKWYLLRFVYTSDGWNWHQLEIIVDYVITSITIVAVAVPEGLPLAVTISLAYSMMKMMKDQNLVRHLAACETMGGATQICSDKTGTLTQNRMSVTAAWITGYNLIDENHIGNIHDGVSAQNLQLLSKSISINSTANIIIKEDNEIHSGPPTEIALLLLLRSLHFDYTAVRAKWVHHVLLQYPFSSSLKRMTTIVAQDDADEADVFVKGASEVILSRCNLFRDENGIHSMDKESQDRFLGIIDEWASRGLRTLSIAYQTINRDQVIEGDPQEKFETNLTLLAIVGISDPVRPEVPQAVKNCQKAGIMVRMLTGDNALTANDIARQCGIKTPDGLVYEGPKFRKLSDQEVDNLLPRLEVIARCSPEDKLKLVRRLKAQGEVVAVTGDGTNDAPQLREADVGFAMGISGTEVAKDASDIILLDDNFTSIQKAVLWGRNVYDSIRKFVQFQLTVNICAVTIAFVGAVTNGESPLRAVQLLWVNLIMDTFAALALATDAPSPSLLDRPPHGRFSPLISRRMWNFIIGSAVFQLSILFTLLYKSEIEFLGLTSETDKDTFRTTIIFNTFVFLQLWNEFNSRKLDNSNVFEGIFSNSIFIIIMVLTVIVQIIMVQYGGAFVQTVPLNLTQWLFCVSVGAFSLVTARVFRSFQVPPEKIIRPLSEPTVIMNPSTFPVESPPSNEEDARRKWASLGKNVMARVKLQQAIKQKNEFVTSLRSPRGLHDQPVILSPNFHRQ